MWTEACLRGRSRWQRWPDWGTRHPRCKVRRSWRQGWGYGRGCCCFSRLGKVSYIINFCVSHSSDSGLAKVIIWFSDCLNRNKLLTHLPPFRREAQYYHKVMKKIIEKGDDFIGTETERLARMLSKYTCNVANRVVYCAWCGTTCTMPIGNYGTTCTMPIGNYDAGSTA